MATNYTRWYRAGTVALSNGSKIITGTDTYWLTAGLNPGDLFTIDGAQFYEVDSVTDNTHLTLKTAYSGASATEVGYSIVRNFTASLPAKIAANTAELLGDFARYIDTDMQSIHGKSAYEVAVSKGYTGTESQWLESLKAAGEWSTLDARTSFISEVTDQGEFRNNIYRGKNLGTSFSSAQLSTIQSGAFDDMYVGDRWTVTFPTLTVPDGSGGTSTLTNSQQTFIIAGFNFGISRWSNSGTYVNKPHILVLWPTTFSLPMNDTKTVEGGFAGSKMFTEYLPALESIPESVFGEGHVLTYREVLTSAVSGGTVSGHVSLPTVKLNLCCDENLHGECFYQPEFSVMAKQFPYFRGNTYLRECPPYWHLRNVETVGVFGGQNTDAKNSHGASQFCRLPIYFLVG